VPDGAGDLEDMLDIFAAETTARVRPHPRDSSDAPEVREAQSGFRTCLDGRLDRRADESGTRSG